MKTRSELNTKMKFFLEKKIKVHIVRTDDIFLNGYLISEIEEGVWLLDEKEMGNIYVFEAEIMKVEEYRSK